MSKLDVLRGQYQDLSIYEKNKWALAQINELRTQLYYLEIIGERNARIIRARQLLHLMTQQTNSYTKLLMGKLFTRGKDPISAVPEWVFELERLGFRIVLFHDITVTTCQVGPEKMVLI